MGQRGRGRGAVVGGAAPVSELSSVEGAAAGGAAGEAVLLRGANTVCRRGGGGAPGGGAARKEGPVSEENCLEGRAGGTAGPHLAFSSVLSSMGGSVLFEGCPDDDMDLVWRGRVELMAVDGVLPDTSVKLDTEKSHQVCIVRFEVCFPTLGTVLLYNNTLCH